MRAQHSNLPKYAQGQQGQISAKRAHGDVNCRLIPACTSGRIAGVSMFDRAGLAASCVGLAVPGFRFTGFEPVARLLLVIVSVFALASSEVLLQAHDCFT